MVAGLKTVHPFIMDEYLDARILLEIKAIFFLPLLFLAFSFLSFHNTAQCLFVFQVPALTFNTLHNLKYINLISLFLPYSQSSSRTKTLPSNWAYSLPQALCTSRCKTKNCFKTLFQKIKANFKIANKRC